MCTIEINFQFLFIHMTPAESRFAMILIHLSFFIVHLFDKEDFLSIDS